MALPVHKLIGLVESQARMVRAQHLDDPVLKVRMHPLDIAYIERNQSPRARVIRIAGCTVEPDCGAGRLNPTVEEA